METLEEAVAALPEDVTLGEINVLDVSGHSRLQWDARDPQQVAAAKAKFDELRSKQFLIYQVDATGNQGVIVDKFDASLGRLIAHPRMVGG